MEWAFAIFGLLVLFALGAIEQKLSALANIAQMWADMTELRKRHKEWDRYPDI